jgi:CrcB protein
MMAGRILVIALGGALGAVLRYGLSGLAYRLAGEGFPWGTLAVNLSGCLAIGILWAAFERAPVPAEWSAFLFIGLIGAYTTYSTFALESMNLLRDGETILALANILASTVGGILLTFAGLFATRSILG